MGEQGTVSSPSVLLAFRATNSRSFKEELELSLVATSLAEQRFVIQVPWREGGSPVSVLPAAGIFGANGSGKSNVLKAIAEMRAHVLHSFRHGDPSGGMQRRPYLLDDTKQSAPTTFEIDVVLDGVRHEYGFTFDDEQVLEEWAYRYPKGRSALLFHRERRSVELGPVERARGRAVVDLMRDNALYLSTAASANHPVLLPLYQWFSRNLVLADAASRPWRQSLTASLLGDDDHRRQVLTLLQAADLGVVDARRHELDPVLRERLRRALRILNGIDDDVDADDGPALEDLGVRLVHRGAHADVELPFEEESLGTLVWFGLIGPVVQALETGSVLLADELDASLHPALVAELVLLFQDPRSNPRRAQLVFNAHDASLLGDATSDRLLGRDQIWFTEKRDDGSTRLYPLVDLEPRKQESIAKRYLAGRYGGVPILSHGEFLAAASGPAVS